MRDTDLSDTDLDLLDKDIPKFCLSPIRLQDMSSRRLQDVFSVTIFRLPRRLQDDFKTSSRRICKTSSKRLGRRKIVMLKTF